MNLFKNTNFDFLRWKWHAIVLSALVILGGIAAMAATGGLPLGIDFSGGTILIVQFEQRISDGVVRDAIAGLPGEEVVQGYGDPADNQMLIRLPQSGPEEGTSLEEGAKAVVAALEQANVGKLTVIGQELVGPVIGRELQQRGINAFIFAMAGILVYIGVRFRFSFAVGAIIATAHDILVTLAFLVFFGYELSLNVIAAMLTITGYSVNDTIVIFDRVRENLRFMRRDKLENLVNTSINQTLGRTVITAGTTFLAVLALYVFGGEVLRGFAFTMLVGIVSGTYSTVFIAAPIALLISERRTARRAEAVPAQAAAGPRSKQQKRKARAS